MKRYKDISYTLARISPLREDENGEYVKYEDVKMMVANILWRNDFASDKELDDFIKNS